MSDNNPNPRQIDCATEPSGFAAGRRRTAIAILAILVLAAAARCYHLAGKSLWLDEFFSLECSAGWARTDLRLPHDATPAPDVISLSHARPWWTIWSSVGTDENHPPLYFILLRGWRVMFGDSADALRSLSVLASLASVVLLFCIGMTVAGPGAAVGATVLMALAWPQIQRAQDARPYALLTTVSLAAALALVRIEKRGISGARLAAVATAALAMPLVHYLALAELAVIVVYAACVLRGRVRGAVLICVGTALLVYVVIWGPHLLGQRAAMLDRTAWLSDAPDVHVRQTWVRLALTPVRLFVQPGPQSSPILCIGGIALLAPLLAVRRHPQVLLWWLWMAAPIGTALAIDLHYGRASLGNTKYTTLAEPAAYLLVGMLATAAGRWGWAVPATLALACVLCLPDVYRPVLEERDWRPMAALLRQTTSPGDPILLIDHRPDWPAGYFLVGLEYYLPQHQRPLLMLDGPPSKTLLEKLARTRRVAMVGSGEDIDRLVLPSGARLVRGELFANLAVVGVVELDPVNRKARP